MRYLKVLVIVVLSVTLLVIVGAVREGPHAGRIPLHSSILESCATEIPPQPRNWEVTSVNLERSVRVFIMADVCRNSLLGATNISGFHLVAMPEHSGSPANMSADELQQLLDQNTLVDLNTTSLGEIRPTIVMLTELPKGIVEYDVRDEATTRRDFAVEFVCNRQCDPGKVRVRLRTALGANFHYVLFNPDPIEL